MTKVFTDVVRKVWLKGGGAEIEVGPDPDGLGCVRVLTRTKDDQDYFGKFDFILAPEIAITLGEAIIATAKELAKEKQ